MRNQNQLRIRIYSRRRSGILKIFQTNMYCPFHYGIKIIALDKSREEAEWLQQFLEDIPLWSKAVPVICIHCDNQVAIFRAQNFIYNGKSRHIHRRHNTVKQLLLNEIISIDFVASKNNLANLFTKYLSGEHINCASKGIRLKEA